MPTQNHDFSYLEPGTYVDDLHAFADAVDALVIHVGPLDDRPSPQDNLLYIDSEGTENADAQSVLYAAVNGSWHVVDLPIAQDLSNATHADQEETLGVSWRFEEVFDTDILGDAVFAENADHAVTTAAASVVGGYTGDDFASDTPDAVVQASWTFAAPQEFRRDISVTGGTLGLPTYGTE